MEERESWKELLEWRINEYEKQEYGSDSYNIMAVLTGLPMRFTTEMIFDEGSVDAYTNEIKQKAAELSSKMQDGSPVTPSVGNQWYDIEELQELKKGFWINLSSGQFVGLCTLAGLGGAAIHYLGVWLVVWFGGLAVYKLVRWIALGFCGNGNRKKLGGKPVVLHPVARDDIFSIEKGTQVGDVLTTKRGWFLSDHCLKEVFQVDVNGVEYQDKPADKSREE